MPEVGIWQSSEVNAFATGWNRDDALVAVSSAILSRMDRNELKAVLGHELSHVANGDMVTMGIIQGIINAFVLWLSVLVASMLSGRGDRDGRAGSAVGYYVIQPVLQIVFGLFGTIVVRWFSRWREYRADAGSAAVYGKAPMIAALRALGAGPSRNSALTAPAASASMTASPSPSSCRPTRLLRRESPRSRNSRTEHAGLTESLEKAALCRLFNGPVKNRISV